MAGTFIDKKGNQRIIKTMIIASVFRRQERRFDSMNTHYHMTIAGCERDLPICPLNDKLSIGQVTDPGQRAELTELAKRRIVEFDGAAA